MTSGKELLWNQIEKTERERDEVMASLEESHGIIKEFEAIIELWQKRAERLYDLLHECAPWVPRGMPNLYDRVTYELDCGLRYLDDQLIGDATEEDNA